MPQTTSPLYYQRTQTKTIKTEYTQQSVQQQTSRKLSYDQQFQLIYEQITQHEYFGRITKHDKIRINKWLTKLSNISTNDLWKKNRNNYIKLIRLMFDCEVIIAPFLMMPPQRDLHKLTTHEINVIIDQVDKIVQEREAKSCLIPTATNGKSTNDTGNINNNKFNRVPWMQESAYVNHHRENSSLEKFKQSENDSRKTYQTSSVTVNNNLSKMSQLKSPLNLIPPKHPSSKSPINSKSTAMNSKSPINYKNPQLQKQPYALKQSQQQMTLPSRKKLRQGSFEPESHSPQNYFRKKERLNTFETQDQQQEEYTHMNDPSRQRNSRTVYETDQYDIAQNHGQNFTQYQSRQAINILKCGFRLLQKLPMEWIQNSSLKEIQTFRKIINQNDFLKHDLQKESRLLDLLSECGTNRTALNEINSLNSTQKINLKKKMKLTVVSQTHRNQSLKTTN